MRKTKLPRRFAARRRGPPDRGCSRPDHFRIAQAVKAARFGIWEWELQTGEVRCAGAVGEIFALEDPCPSMEAILERIHPDDRRLVRLPAREGPFAIEYRVLLPDGSWRWVASRGLVECDARGHPVRRLAAIFDITALKAAQQTALELKEREERLVAKRTAMLEETVRQLEAFSFSVSHDIRAPLRAMLNYADMAQRACYGKVDAKTLSLLNRIAAAASRLEKLTHDLLRFSRLSKAAPSLGPVDVAPLIFELLEEYPVLEGAKAFFHFGDVRVRVLGNESLLRQALSNLLENAVRFRDPERPLTVKVWAQESEGRVKLFIQDNGLGIAARHRDRVFRPFERLRPGEGGVGMGLAIAKNAVERMDGRIDFLSEPGKGTTFWIDLPKARA